MTASISKLHDNGDVTIELTSLESYGLDPDQYFPEFESLVKPGISEYRVSADLASRMAHDGQIDAIPAGWTFGYPHAYVGDGFLLCPTCVLKQVKEFTNDPENPYDNCGVDPEQMTCQLFVYGETPQSGDACDNCYEYIPGVEPYCGECSSTDKPLISSDSGEHMLCRDCIADRIVKTRNETLSRYDDPAYMTGLHTFKVGYDTYQTA